MNEPSGQCRDPRIRSCGLVIPLLPSTGRIESHERSADSYEREQGTRAEKAKDAAPFLLAAHYTLTCNHVDYKGRGISLSPPHLAHSPVQDSR